MADLGLSSTFGVGAMQQSVRQRILDALQREAMGHQQSVEDQRLDLERQRVQQEAENQKLIRSQQSTAFNESVGEKAGANLGPGQTVLSPSQAAPILAAPSMRGLIMPDQTLPSTQIAAGGAPPTTEITPSTQVAGTTPTITQQAPQLTGQLRFMGTPQANQAEASRVRLSQLTSSMPAGSPERRALEYEQATGKNAPAGIFDKTTTGEPLEQVIGPDGKPVLKPRSQSAGMTPYHVPPPPSTVTIQTVDENGKPVTKIVTKAEALKQGSFTGKPSGATETRLASAQAVNQTGDDIIAQLSKPEFAATVGPVMGRAGTLRDFIGNPPPEFAQLAGEIESYALASMGVHGMRSAQGAQQISKLLDAHHTPESLIATIRGLNSFSQHFMENEGRTGTATAKTPNRTRYDMNGNVIK